MSVDGRVFLPRFWPLLKDGFGAVRTALDVLTTDVTTVANGFLTGLLRLARNNRAADAESNAGWMVDPTGIAEISGIRSGSMNDSVKGIDLAATMIDSGERVAVELGFAS